jgi:hypothetical protein
LVRLKVRAVVAMARLSPPWFFRALAQSISPGQLRLARRLLRGGRA